MSPAELASAFEEVLAAGQVAAARGDYGIGASLIVASDGVEARFVTGNAVFSTGDPCAHAEVRVLAAARTALADSSAILRLGPASVPGRRVHALCAAEPCMVCTQALASSGVTSITVAVPDPRAGALLQPDLLPVRWGQLVSAMKIVVCQSRRADRPGFLPEPLLNDLAQTFDATTGRLAPSLTASGGMPGALAVRLAA